jgi:hypothetical protein
MTASLVIQIALFALSALLPVFGIIRIYTRTRRDLRHLTRTAMLIKTIEGPAGGNYSPRVADDIKKTGIGVDFPWADDIADKARLLEHLRADFFWIGLGVGCGAGASIWSLIEAAL